MVKKLEQKIISNKKEIQYHSIQVLWGLCLYFLFFFAKYKTSQLPDTKYYLIILSTILLAISESKNKVIKTPIYFITLLFIGFSTILFRGTDLNNTTLINEVVLLFLATVYLSKYDKEKLFSLLASISAVYVIDEVIFEQEFLLNFNDLLIGRAANSGFLGESLVLSIPFLIREKKLSSNLITRSFLSLLLSVSIFLIFRSLSRAAIIGLIFLLLIELYFKLKFSNNVRVKVLMIIILILSTFTISVIIKKNSTSGRILINKISLTNYSEYLILGNGPGSVQKKYLAYQESYFDKNKRNESEELLADNVHFVYNDFLKNLIELGIIGFIIFIIPLIVILRRFELIIITTEGQIGMLYYLLSLFTNASNLLFGTFIFYIIILEIIKGSILGYLFKIKLIALQVLFCFVSLIIINEIKKNYDWQLAIDRYKTNSTFALRKMKELESSFKNNGEFLFYYASMLLHNQNKNEAIEKYKMSLEYMNRSEVLNNIGNIYFSQKNYPKAIQFFKRSNNVVPNRFVPLYMIFTSYKSLNNYDSACFYSNIIIKKKIKINSETITIIKNEALEWYLNNCQ